MEAVKETMKEGSDEKRHKKVSTIEIQLHKSQKWMYRLSKCGFTIMVGKENQRKNSDMVRNGL